jgi:hypothetical protein
MKTLQAVQGMEQAEGILPPRYPDEERRTRD